MRLERGQLQPLWHLGRNCTAVSQVCVRTKWIHFSEWQTHQSLFQLWCYLCFGSLNSDRYCSCSFYRSVDVAQTVLIPRQGFHAREKTRQSNYNMINCDIANNLITLHLYWILNFKWKSCLYIYIYIFAYI